MVETPNNNAAEQANANANADASTAPSSTSAPSDFEETKGVSAIAYLGILFFVPMITHPKSEYAMFHVNQGLLLLITAIAVNIVGSVVPIIGWLIITPIGSIFVLVLLIMGIINAVNGRMKRLPLIGQFDLIKPAR